jgi:hypothetical protein
MRDNDTVRSILLDLGLEDLIPLPEAVATPELRAAAGERDLIDTIARALGELVREDRIRLFRGIWNAEPQPVPIAEGVELLQNAVWYRFRIDDPHEERLYFVNVDNLQSS